MNRDPRKGAHVDLRTVNLTFTGIVADSELLFGVGSTLVA